MRNPRTFVTETFKVGIIKFQGFRISVTSYFHHFWIRDNLIIHQTTVSLSIKYSVFVSNSFVMLFSNNNIILQSEGGRG